MYYYYCVQDYYRIMPIYPILVPNFEPKALKIKQKLSQLGRVSTLIDIRRYLLLKIILF